MTGLHIAKQYWMTAEDGIGESIWTITFNNKPLYRRWHLWRLILKIKKMERNSKGQFTSNMTSEDKVKIWSLTPKGVKWAIVIGLTAVAIIYLLSSCQTTHGVIQSSQQSQYVKGDTTVTEISIKYEQTGRVQR